MIHHISVAVDNPLHIAEVLSEVLQGHLYPFPPHPGSYMVINGDEHGTGIELLPAGTELIPGTNESQFQANATPSHFTPFHAAISVPTSQEKMEQIGTREGWLVRFCDRGPFAVMEFWIENKLMLEFLTPEMAPQYLEFAKPQNYEAFFTVAPATVS
jgi:hypothetical protein